MQYTRQKSPQNRNTRNVYKVKKKKPSKSKDFGRKTQVFSANLLKTMHQEAESGLKSGLIDDSLQLFAQCIEEYFVSVDEDLKHPGFSTYYSKTLKLLNENALRLLKENKLEESLLVLTRCREFIDGRRYGENTTMSSLTYNHMACWYRRDGKLLVALKYLEKAMEALAGTEEHEFFGMTHLNLCAIYSQMGDHKKALENAKRAVNNCSFDHIKQTVVNGSDAYSEVKNKKVMLAISYHNLGIEEDHCGNYENSRNAFAKAYEIIQKENGPDDPIAKKFFAVYTESKAKALNSGLLPIYSAENGQSHNRSMSLKPSATSSQLLKISRPTSAVNPERKKSIIVKTKTETDNKTIEKIPSSENGETFKEDATAEDKHYNSHRSTPKSQRNGHIEEKLTVDFGPIVDPVDTKTNRITFLKTLHFYNHTKKKPIELGSRLDPAAIVCYSRFTNDLRITSQKVLSKEDKAAIKIQKRVKGMLARKKYKKMLKVRKYVYLYKSVERYMINLEDAFEKHPFEIYIWLDLLSEKMTFNLFSVTKQKLKLKGVLKFNIEQRDNFNQLKDHARGFAKAHLQKLTIENNTVVFGTVTPEEIQAYIESKPPSKNEIPSIEEEKVSEPEPKQYDIPMVIKIQKFIRGHLTRKRHFHHNHAFWDTIFSKNFRFKERLINFRVLQQFGQKEKAEKATTPVHIIYGMDLTVRIEFDSIPFPERAVNPKRATLQKLQEMIDIDIYSHTLELHPEYVLKSAYEISNHKANLEKNTENELSRSETLKYISREHLHSYNTILEGESKKQQPGTTNSFVSEEEKQEKVEEEQKKKSQKLMKRKHRFAVFVMRLTLYFGELKTTIYVFWLPHSEEILVELHRKDAEAQELVLVLKDLNLFTFQKRELSLEFDLRFLPYVSYEDGNLVFKKGEEVKRSAPITTVQAT